MFFSQTLQTENQKMQLQTEELSSQMSETALNETRMKELSELQQELAGKIDEMNSLNVRLAASLQVKPPAIDS